MEQGISIGLRPIEVALTRLQHEEVQWSVGGTVRLSTEDQFSR
jgi:hypothetical protein